MASDSATMDVVPVAANTHRTTEEEVTVERTEATEEERLRYMEFVQAAAAHALVLAAAAYAYTKQGAGPLRPGVDHIEGTVKAVVGPVYDRFHAVPLDLFNDSLFPMRPGFPPPPRLILSPAARGGRGGEMVPRQGNGGAGRTQRREAEAEDKADS